MIKTVLTLALVAIAPFALVACGGADEGSSSQAMSEGQEHAAQPDHAAHAGHAAHADHAKHDGAAMGSMGDAKVDPEGAVKVFDSRPVVGDKAICPVSGEVFLVTGETVMSEFEGGHVAFCCPACKPKFDADPGKYTEAG
jgi:YHS domain-containing protein